LLCPCRDFRSSSYSGNGPAKQNDFYRLVEFLANVSNIEIFAIPINVSIRSYLIFLERVFYIKKLRKIIITLLRAAGAAVAGVFGSCFQTFSQKSAAERQLSFYMILRCPSSAGRDPPTGQPGKLSIDRRLCNTVFWRDAQTGPSTTLYESFRTLTFGVSPFWFLPVLDTSVEETRTET